MGGTFTIDATWIDEISDAATADSCADAVKGIDQDGIRYILPRAPQTTSFDGHVLSVLAVVTNYHGPAGYDAPLVRGADGTPTILAVDGAGWAVVGGGTAHVDVKPDNSGTLVYQKLAPTPPTPAPTVSGNAPPTTAPAQTGTVSGTLTWTCAGVRSTATPTPSPSPTPTAPPPPPVKPKPTPTPTPRR